MIGKVFELDLYMTHFLCGLDNFVWRLCEYENLGLDAAAIAIKNPSVKQRLKKKYLIEFLNNEIQSKNSTSNPNLSP